jgi:hypothetical protein
MPVPDFHVDVSGESFRVWGAHPRFTVAREGGAQRVIAVTDSDEGWRRWSWEETTGPTATLSLLPTDPGEPWRMDVLPHEEPMVMLAVLHAAERLAREAELRGR